LNAHSLLRGLGRLQLWLFCGAFYWLLLTPYALLLRLCGKRFLEGIDRGAASYWEDAPPRDPAESSRRPY
jgi:hypothetical protein